MTTEPPASLNDEGRQIWRDTLAQLMQAGTRADPNSILAYTRAVQDNRRAAQLLSQSDILVNRNGNPVPNPALQIEQQSARIIADFDRQYRLNTQTPQNDTPHSEPTHTGPRGRWCPQHNRFECYALNQKEPHEQCHGIAVLGIGRCRRHAGVKTETSAAHLLALQQVRNPLHGEPMNIGAAEAMLWRVRVIAGEVARIDEYLAGLQGDEQVVVREVRGPDGTKQYSETLLTIWTAMRAERERALGSACAAAIQANVQASLVDIARQEGMVFRRVMLAVLQELGHDTDDPVIAEIVPRKLRELTA